MNAGNRVRASVLIALSLLVSSCDDDAAATMSGSQFQRLVTLAPNLTELVFAVGAGDALVGVSAYSDYPPAAQELPLVGDAFAIDHEQLALLMPDLLLVWESGTPAHIVDELRGIGYEVEVVRTRSLNDVARALVRIGQLAGRPEQALEVAHEYRKNLDALAQANADSADIRVFYQVSRRPLYTVNGEHYVSELIDRCGGTNVFDDLGDLAPAIAVEAVLERNPEVMLASSDAGDDAFSEWRRWPQLAAVRLGNQFLMPADEIGRATTRLVAAGVALCAALDTGRLRRAAAASQ